VPKLPDGRRRVIGQAEAGSRLDLWLARLAGAGSRRRAKTWLERGKVFLNGHELSGQDAGRLLAPGDNVELWIDRPGSAAAPPRGLAAARVLLRPAFEDPFILVADKPPGLLIEPLPGARAAVRNRPGTPRPPAARSGLPEITLLDLVRDHVRSAPGTVPRVVHRIDRDTSGLVVFALTLDAWVHLKRQFARRTAERVYLAVVEGLVRDSRGTWTNTLAWHAGRKRQAPARPDEPGGRQAVASFEVLEQFRGAALLQVRLATGRRNQIRIQAGLHGHPVVGEKVYRLGHREGALTFARQALHAARLSLVHPVTGKRVSFVVPLPEDLVGLIRKLRKASR